jgi:signal transduction histidine kinase
MKFARQEKVAFMTTSVNNVVEDSMAIVDHQLSINKVKLEKNLGANIPNVHGSGNQIQQVLINLMINAQQAMNGNPGHISLETALVNPEQIEIRVKDDGPGIPEEIQSKIFEPFFTTKASGEGTGLGLSVSYGIIKDHGGDIRIDSEAGKGTSFIITLPVKSSENV